MNDLKSHRILCWEIGKFAWKIQKLSEKGRKFLSRIHDPQILNQIDAAGHGGITNLTTGPTVYTRRPTHD